MPPKPAPAGLRGAIRLVLSGLCMGSADLIPGVSGGTICFILGIYSDLIESVRTFNLHAFSLLARGRFWLFQRAVAWEFLGSLGLGVACAFIMLSQLIHFLLEVPLYRGYLYAGFIGLVLGSVYFCKRQVRVWNWAKKSALLLGLGVAFWATGADWSTQTAEPLYDVQLVLNASTPLLNYDLTRSVLTNVPQSTLAAMLAGRVLSPGALVYNHDKRSEGAAAQFVTPRQARPIEPWLIICGAMASCALLLPGISGSYLLTAIGVYPMIIGALVDFVVGLGSLSVDWPASLVLVNVLIGIVIGLMSFSHVVSWLLKRYHDITIATMIGAMIGATRVLWPFYSFAYMVQPLKPHQAPSLMVLEPLTPDFSTSQPWFALACAVIGFAVVVGLEKAASMGLKTTKRQEKAFFE